MCSELLIVKCVVLFTKGNVTNNYQEKQRNKWVDVWKDRRRNGELLHNVEMLSGYKEETHQERIGII